MGQYDFRPARVYQTASRLLECKRIQSPAWYNAVSDTPPSQTIVRTQPIQHSQRSIKRQKKKPSKLFQPQRITYEEDTLRRQFFTDHPWELARPRAILETDGKDHHRHDWSSIRQDTRILDGESVVQRQLWLRQNHPDMTRAEAYAQARQEFYAERLRQQTEIRVAKEEALTTSAYFGKSRLQIGAELEDKSYESWRRTAQDSFLALEQKRASAISTYTSRAEAETPADHPSSTDAAVGMLEEIQT